jgi:long-chain acyl-CoA synthetase
MRQIIYQLYNELKKNTKNRIFFFREGKRLQKTYAEFSNDIDIALAKLNFLKQTRGIEHVALIGPVSYDWIVCDMACIKGGFLTIAVPETLPAEEVECLAKETKAGIALLDVSLKQKYSLTNVEVFYFECNGREEKKDFWSLPEAVIDHNENLILKKYSIVFSSGTSGKMKRIIRTFPYIDKKKEKNLPLHKKIIRNIEHRRSIWARKNNKLIIFMPFSHSQQRDFFRTALLRKVDIVLSDQKNCIKHIITERPNLMVSVPLIYEMMASRISEKIKRFNKTQRFFFKVFNSFRINTLSDRNWIKKSFSFLLLNDIRKIYGGRADYFVTGSAAISINVLKTFYSVGVKLLQAYGQTELGILAMSTPKHFRLGSVGKPTNELKISKDSEILVWYNDWVYSHNKDVLTVNGEDYIQTGDLGYIDKDGYLFITGRKDDIIVLDNGKKIFPENIELLLISFDGIEDACVFAKDGYKLHAVLTCAPKISEPNIRSLVQAANNKLPHHEQIRAFWIADTKFSTENGLLTSTFKKKRNAIKEYSLNNKFTTV